MRGSSEKKENSGLRGLTAGGRRWGCGIGFGNMPVDLTVLGVRAVRVGRDIETCVRVIYVSSWLYLDV